jgi:hypothetical protein
VTRGSSRPPPGSSYSGLSASASSTSGSAVWLPTTGLRPRQPSATVHAWASLVADGQLRAVPDRPAVQVSLAKQIGNWHELVVVDVDPETLLKPYAGQRFTRITPKLVGSFAAEFAIGSVGLGALVSLASMAVGVQGAVGWKTVAVVAGVLGVTIGGSRLRSKTLRSRSSVASELTSTPTSSLAP